jgi:anthranilate/para-aminobenzoate synthase component II
MHVLIIDNGTLNLEQLKKVIHGSSDVISYSQIKEKTAEYFQKYDTVILSGGSAFPIVGNETILHDEISLIRNLNKPIFGICYGFELIAAAFGAELERKHNKIHGTIEMKVIESDKIFKDIPNFKVYESHRWVVKEIPDCLLALARSKDGIEAFKHKTLPIYAVQFHPEMHVDQTCGNTILQNFLSSLVSQDLENF